VRATGVMRNMRVPKYATIFQASIWNGRWRLEFNDTTPGPFDNFAVHLRRMIVGSDNDSAGFCVRALGYSWIDGLLQAAGFLDLGLTSREGIWLAGDYAAQPTVEIASVNDRDVKQATTTFNMAWLLTLLYDKKLVKETVDLAAGQSGNDEMLRLLELAVDHPGAPSLLKRVSIPFTVRQSKIGVGELKVDPNNPPTAGSCITVKGCVYSEAAIVEHWSGHKFVVVYQNMLDGRLADLSRIADVIQKTMDGYR
jgi:Beta-lactamase enzyme family